jgi:D-alanyl-D-alanine carboxypeptidase/D-alanyl-D-alanine-endopeptidase (penicillin-binding protein 4)
MKSINRIGLVLTLCAAPLTVSCTARVSPMTRSALPAPDSLSLLRSDLDYIFADPNFVGAQWGVEVLSLDRAEPVYERNSTRLYLPASNNKVLTAAAALVRLGPDFRYETPVLTDGSIAGGVLRGNLVVAGTGDPTNAPRFQGGDPFRTFRDWASILKEKGVRRIEGDLIGDEAAFERSQLGNGWEWHDLAFGYAAPVSALQFNENLVVLEIAPGEEEGSPALLKARPLEKYLNVQNRVTTAAFGSAAGIEVERGEGREAVIVSGSVPLKGEPLTQAVSVQLPTEYYLDALKLVLQQEGVDVSACSVKGVRGWHVPVIQLLWTHRSPTLADIIKPMLKVSQNLYAETLARTLGLRFRGDGSFSSGKEVIEEALQEMAVEKGTYVYADGSGLSRLNLLSADLLVRIFKYMYRNAYFRQFYEALPVAGVDGTIAERMKGTKAEANVRAKTGSIAHVLSLSGYVQTADGEMLAFAMIANNFLASRRMAEYVQDLAAERLADFTRK